MPQVTSTPKKRKAEEDGVFKYDKHGCQATFDTFQDHEDHKYSQPCATKRRRQESGYQYLAKNYSEMFTASKTREKLMCKEKHSMMTNFDGMKAVRPRDSIPRDESLDTFQGFSIGSALKIVNRIQNTMRIKSAT